MKIALYIEDGLEQVVLTPETDTERRILAKLHEADRDVFVKHGGFYYCHGGWMRESGGSDSSMLVLRPKAKTPAEPA